MLLYCALFGLGLKALLLLPKFGCKPSPAGMMAEVCAKPLRMTIS